MRRIIISGTRTLLFPAEVSMSIFDNQNATRITWQRWKLNSFEQWLTMTRPSKLPPNERFQFSFPVHSVPKKLRKKSVRWGIKHMSMLEIIWVTRSDNVCWGEANKIYERDGSDRCRKSEAARSEDLFLGAFQMINNARSEWRKSLVGEKLELPVEMFINFSSFLSLARSLWFDNNCLKIVDWQWDEIFLPKSDFLCGRKMLSEICR